jgi:hypothetical protein
MHKKGVFADTEKICFTAPKRGKFIRKNTGIGSFFMQIPPKVLES